MLSAEKARGNAGTRAGGRLKRLLRPAALRWSARSRRTELAIVAAMMTLAMFMRLPALLGDGLWRDEANVYVQLTAPNFAEFFHRVITTEWHPPLFFLIMYGWSKLAGTSEMALTIVPFVFSVATVAAVYALGRALGSRTTGALAAGLYAVSPLAITYCDELLYPLMMFVSTVLALLVVEAVRRPLTMPRLSALAIVALLVVATHYTGLIYITLLIVWVLAQRAGRRERAFAVAALIAGTLPFVVWVPVFLRQRAIGLPWRAAETLIDKAALVTRTLIECAPVRPALAVVAFFVLVIVACLATIRARTLDRGTAGFGVVFFAALSALAAQNVLESRYMLTFYGLFCAVVGSVLARYAALLRANDPRMWRRWGAAAAGLLGLALIAGDAADAVSRSQIPKSGIRSIVHQRATEKTTLYLIAPDYLASTFAFYADGRRSTAMGFVRWDRPEVFRIAGYAADWNRADAVVRTLRAVGQSARRYQLLDVVADDNAHDSGAVAYGKVKLLIADLRASYHFIGRTRHAGRNEAVSEYRFQLERI